MNPLSLKWRVILVVVTILVATITTICIVAHAEFEESHLGIIDRTLQAITNGVLASAENTPDNKFSTEEIRAVTGANGPNSTTLCRVWTDEASADLFCSERPTDEGADWLRSLPEKERPLQGQATFFDIGRVGDEHRAMWTRRDFETGILNVVVAVSSHYTYHEMWEFLVFMVLLGMSLIVVSAVFLVFGVQWALGPIDSAANQLNKIEQPTSPRHFTDIEKTPEELRPFIRSLTDMLYRLESVFERQRRFTADAAHELRTPLALAKSTLQTAQMAKMESGDYERTIEDVLCDVVRIERLVDQLLLLARMEETGAETVTSEVQLDALLSELAENLCEKVSRSGGRLLFEEPPSVTVHGNLDELICLFRNVLDNAMKYGPPNGNIRMTLDCEAEGYVVVHIHDEGGRIPPEVLPHLFDRFYRADQSRSSSTGGTGLGLAIAREIINRHHGDISITSEPESGTLVRIRLPRMPQRLV